MEALLEQLFHPSLYRRPRHIIKTSLPAFQWGQIFDSGMRDNFDYASYRFAMDSLLSQSSMSLRELQQSVCQIRSAQWANLSPPDLAHKVARYHTQTPFAFGVYDQEIFKVMSPIPSSTIYSITHPIEHHSGMFKIHSNHSKVDLWLEPITGRTFVSPTTTFYSLIASWVPTTEGNQYFPLEDKVRVRI